MKFNYKDDIEAVTMLFIASLVVGVGLNITDILTYVLFWSQL